MTKFFTIFCFLCFFSFNLLSAQDKHSIHRVKEGETIEGIAKRYVVTPFDIYKLNPEAKSGLKPNTILIIPQSKVEKKVTIVKELQGFKTHKTKRKETLYSLAKKYNIEETDIKKHNTFLYANPLRKGDKLQIPVFKTTEVVEDVALYKSYIVQPKEGKWRIAYKFGITVAELEAINPEMGDILQEGQEIKVPNLEKEQEKEVDEQFSYYKVLPKEGFYRLKVKLGIEKAELETLNPGLAESGLKVGMILKIPFNEVFDGGKEVTINLADSISDYDIKHIAVMLPFRLNRVDFDSIPGTKKSIKKDPYLNASLDFHSGVLMAIDSLQRLGISLKVDVYDTQNQESEVIDIIKNNNFETVDAVIGPLMTSTFEKASSELRNYQVPIVSPIGANLKLYDNVFQSRASSELLNSRLINHIKSDTLVNNVIIISDSKHLEVANTIKKEFISAKQVLSRKDKKTGKDQYFIVRTDIENVLAPGNNVVFLETKDAGLVSNVTSVLASLIQKKDISTKTEERNITLVTTNFNKAFEDNDISNEHLSKLQFCYATTSKSYALDNAFVKSYKEKYHTTPNKRAVKGFDLTMDVVLRLVTSEDLFMSVNEAPVTEYVENKFAYKKKMFGGYFNDTVYLVKHQDLQIVEVKQ